MILLPGILAAAGQVQQFFQGRGWRFCFIGGVAVQRWGEPRLTQDVDVTLLTGFGQEQEFVDALLEKLRLRRPDGRAFALSHRVLLAQTEGGVNVDVALGGLAFEERTIARASDWRPGGSLRLRTCSAEDLIVHKSFAGRDLDWSDIERVLIRQHGKLNLNLIRTELTPLLELKGTSESGTRLERMIRTVDGRLG